MRENGLQYTLVSPAGSLTLNPTGFSGSGWYIDSGGMNFQASLQAAVSNRPQQHGSYLDNAYKSGLVGAVKVLNMAATAALRQSQADNLVLVLSSLTGDQGTGTMSWTPQDGGSARRLQGLQLIGEYAFEQVAGTLKSVNFLLGCERPYCESNTATNYDTSAMTAAGTGFVVPLTIPFTLLGSGGGTTSVTNSGNVYAYPLLRVYGPIVDPVIADTTNDLRLSLTGSIAAGDYWEIDLFDHTIRLNGAGSTSPGSVDLSESDWFGFAPGVTDVQLAGSGYNSSTYLRVLMRSAWG